MVRNGELTILALMARESSHVIEDSSWVLPLSGGPLRPQFLIDIVTEERATKGASGQ
jgi:hypothetical protein